MAAQPQKQLRARFWPLLVLWLISFSVISAGPATQEHTPGQRTAAANEADSLALVALFNETRSYNWENESNWLTGRLHTWYGVTVVNGRVTELRLAENGLRHNVPNAITDLTALEILHLNNNAIQSIPDLSALGKLALREVNVAGNSLDFGSLEPNMNQDYTLEYLPQSDFISLSLLPRRVHEGEPFSVTADAGGTSSQYQWYMGREALGSEPFPIPGANSQTYAVAEASAANAGLPLVVKVTNPVVPGVTLMGTKFFTFVPRNKLRWLDIGEYHHAYSPNGARKDEVTNTEGMDYPAIDEYSGHFRSKSFWIGVKDWTDEYGTHYPFYVGRVGGQAGRLIPTSEQTASIKSELIGRYPDTVVEVNGQASYDHYEILDAIDPNLPADRMLHTVNNMSMGITVDRKVYAFTNAYHDNYHLIDYQYCNTGNTDGDAEIELPNQTLNDVIFFRAHAWRGHEQASWAAISGQAWARFMVHDVVGDGHAEYPVDFTAQYGWIGWSFGGFEAAPGGIIDFGGPLVNDSHSMVAPGDSVGRLAAATMMGRMVLHADFSTTDTSYDRSQPSIMSWLNNDSNMHSDGQPHESYYRFGILGPMLGFDEADCIPCRRSSPHFADLNADGNPFWELGLKITGGFDGGFAATTGYGPYDMGPNECINVTVAEGIDGLSFDAATKIGRAYKWAGADKNTRTFAFDANGDGVINTAPHNYEQVFAGTETQTKNQWVLSARDSLFGTFYHARDAFEASNKFSVYPVAEPPHAPATFTVQSSPPDGIALSWTPTGQGPEIDRWEIFRTEDRADNRYVNGCLEDVTIVCGYEHIASLPANATQYTDTDVMHDTAYYYYIQAVGTPQPVAENAVRGTPGGRPLRSGRYLTQTYHPVTTAPPPEAAPAAPQDVALLGNYPNPFTNTTRFRYYLEEPTTVRLAVYDILGREIQTLTNEMKPAGLYTVDFEPQNLASGVYIYVFEAGDQRKDGTMLLVR